MATKKIVTPAPAQPAFELPLPAHVDAVNVENMDCQTKDMVGSALGCGFAVRDGILFADDGRAFKVDVFDKTLILT